MRQIEIIGLMFVCFCFGYVLGKNNTMNGLCDQHKINAVYMCVEQKDK